MPAEICSDSESLKNSCIAITAFSFLYFLVALALLLFFSFKPKNLIKKTLFLIASVIALFLFADLALKQLTHPNTWGLDLFIISYYFWCFLVITVFVFALLFPYRQKMVIIALLGITLVLTVFFGFWGRGTEEMLSPIFGLFFYEKTFSSFTMGFTYKLVVFTLLSAFVYSLVFQAIYWVQTSNVDIKLFFQPYYSALKFMPILLVPTLSYFIGSYVNERDVSAAKSFIWQVKSKTDKYYLENGEYPRVIEAFINSKETETPWLLKRHEYFSYDIPGTYYFSRADKYCFIFQNPNKDFGYYSITSTRDWRYIEEKDSFDNLYLELCDETQNSSEDLIAGRMGLEGTNDFLGELGIEMNKHIVPAISRETDRILHNKIIDYGKTQDPTIFKYYGNSPKEIRKIYDQPDDIPAAEDIK